MKTNYHTHTTFCDGKNTPEEVVRAAIAQGFDEIGFSSHSEMLKDPDAYVAEIRRLETAYRGKIRIFCGLEADWPCPLDLSPYDYVIGSVHFVPTATGERQCVDKSPEDLMQGIRDGFGGSAEAFVRAYFQTEREMVAAGRFTFVGHPDLVRKFNAKHPYFDENAAWYREELLKTADAIAACGKPVEVNTGAISRGWLDDVYPSAAFRALLRERGVRFVLSSDSHAADTLDCAFDRFGAAERYLPLDAQNGILRSCKFSSNGLITKEVKK